MKKNRLKSGYTTGACAAAAAKGAALMLRDGALLDEVEITLPGGEKACFRLYGRDFGEKQASCHVIKDAGDDPDVTHGAEIHATVTLAHLVDGVNDCRVIIEGGVGIGKITKPGLAVPVGAWAINPVPRRMINEAVIEVFPSRPRSLIPRVVISIPNGEKLAKKTLNARLGVIGGLSILGTTGIVRPISADAWTDTIEAAIDVALACGCETLVLSTGRTSEHTAQRFFSETGKNETGIKDKEINSNTHILQLALNRLPPESFIIMGDHVGYAIRACARKGVKKVVIAGQFAKLLKIACGHEQTHVKSSKLDLRMLSEWLKASPRSSHFALYALNANTAREVLELCGESHELASLVCGKAARFARSLAPGLYIKVLLAGYRGEMLYCSPN
jgi:cobalt-precorrin-5B (C1)-methyltransferase